MEKILVAVDGSDHSRRAVDLAADLASRYDAGLLLLHVVENRPLSEEEKRLAETEYSKEIDTRRRAGGVIDTLTLETEGFVPVVASHVETGLIIHTVVGEGILKTARSEAKLHGAKDVTTILENGDPAQTILDVASRNKADLIVIGSRGQSDIKALFLGSVSHKVTNLADVSVITVK